MRITPNAMLISILQKYISAVIQGEHKHAIESWHLNGKRIIADIETESIVFQTSPADKKFTNYKPNPDIHQNAVPSILEFTSTTAVGKIIWQVESDTEEKKCIDYLLLIKAKESWKIVSKVSHFDYS